jgi:hypothetical protein
MFHALLAVKVLTLRDLLHRHVTLASIDGQRTGQDEEWPIKFILHAKTEGLSLKNILVHSPKKSGKCEKNPKKIQKKSKKSQKFQKTEKNKKSKKNRKKQKNPKNPKNLKKSKKSKKSKKYEKNPKKIQKIQFFGEYIEQFSV